MERQTTLEQCWREEEYDAPEVEICENTDDVIYEVFDDGFVKILSREEFNTRKEEARRLAEGCKKIIVESAVESGGKWNGNGVELVLADEGKVRAAKFKEAWEKKYGPSTKEVQNQKIVPIPELEQLSRDYMESLKKSQ